MHQQQKCKKLNLAVLMRWGVPKVAVRLMLLLFLVPGLQLSMDMQAIEGYAGDARITFWLQYHLVRALPFDLRYSL